MKNEERLKLFWRGYVCISSRGPLPPLDLELYSRASQIADHSKTAHAGGIGYSKDEEIGTDKQVRVGAKLLMNSYSSPKMMR